MEFTVSSEIFAAFPGMRIAVAAARGIDNSVTSPAAESMWRRAWKDAAAASAFGNAQSHPRVAPWRERMKAVGVSGKQFPSSIEALLRRALKGGGPFTINPLVDFYNAVSLSHVVPAGGFDLAQIHRALELRNTGEGDHFQALDDAEPIDLPAGEIAYVDGNTVLTRHFVWRQSRDGLISPATRDVLLLSEVLGEIEDGVAGAVLEDFRGGLERIFGVTAHGGLVDAEHPVFSWE